MTIASLVPDPSALLSLEIEELSGVLLEILTVENQSGQMNRHNFFNDLDQRPPYPQASRETKESIGFAFREAWSWLESQGFIAFKAGSSGDMFFITRSGRRVATRKGMRSYSKINLLPRGKLHRTIEDRVYSTFLRGEYDTAVFQAFREVEVAVRTAGGFPPEAIGVKLMREAFRTGQTAGPLTDSLLPIAEQEAMMNLFAGAIGLYKNPQSHRNVPTDPMDAAEVIVFASHLLRLVDRLGSRAQTP
jgi:uncharacterized protein (TIGR02391 family)